MRLAARTTIGSLLFAACGGAASAPTTVTPAPLATPEAAAAPCPDSALRRVVLLDAGRAPRRALRTAFATSSHQRFTLSHRETTQLIEAGKPAAAEPEPALTVAGTADVLDVTADGTARIELRLSASASSYAKLEIDRCGVLRTYEAIVEPADQATVTPQLQHARDALWQLRPALPSEPVGAGARWTVSMDVTSYPPFTETSTYELGGDPAAPTFALHYDNLVPPQPEGDHPAAIKGGEQTGSGAGAIAVATVMPAHATMAGNLSDHAREGWPGGGRPVDIRRRARRDRRALTG